MKRYANERTCTFQKYLRRRKRGQVPRENWESKLGFLNPCHLLRKRHWCRRKHSSPSFDRSGLQIKEITAKNIYVTYHRHIWNAKAYIRGAAADERSKTEYDEPPAKHPCIHPKLALLGTQIRRARALWQVWRATKFAQRLGPFIGLLTSTRLLAESTCLTCAYLVHVDPIRYVPSSVVRNDLWRRSPALIIFL